MRVPGVDLYLGFGDRLWGGTKNFPLLPWMPDRNLSIWRVGHIQKCDRARKQPDGIDSGFLALHNIDRPFVGGIASLFKSEASSTRLDIGHSNRRFFHFFIVDKQCGAGWMRL